ncbi:hypothetical protein LEP1GSC151_5340 [Leptospira interrogans serovar Grippotyphosa str. LT2186]|uniref:Uncharacterized protein n=1 Tax=Leptospira interrogans serovar Grippotyphosa str. LT2186 TaxID=1001599 RepID=M3HFH9_LEPIR|nr:hypothetical protein LEP1GSC151_5340 [Leptospira interrogans serovar Grippotyphosa str. LT2186]
MRQAYIIRSYSIFIIFYFLHAFFIRSIFSFLYFFSFYEAQVSLTYSLHFKALSTFFIFMKSLFCDCHSKKFIL